MGSVTVIALERAEGLGQLLTKVSREVASEEA